MHLTHLSFSPSLCLPLPSLSNTSNFTTKDKKERGKKYKAAKASHFMDAEDADKLLDNTSKLKNNLTNFQHIDYLYPEHSSFGLWVVSNDNEMIVAVCLELLLN